MTTYNTGNPIGSTDSRDRLDNTENLDKAVNSTNFTFIDRLGRKRDTLEGMGAKFGGLYGGNFTDGFTVENRGQYFYYENSGNAFAYQWVGSPLALTVAAGTAPSDYGVIGADWIDKTDVALRNELLSGAIRARSGFLALRDLPTIVDYGADATGSVDCSSHAAAMALDFGFIRFPVGEFMLNTCTIDVPIVFDAGAYITVPSGQTLTISNRIESSRQYIFRGDGSYNIGHDSNSGEDSRQIHVSWFGAFPSQYSASNTDQAPYINKAFQAVGNARESVVLFDIGNYLLRSQVTVTRGGAVKGMGTRRTVFIHDTDGFTSFITGNVACKFEDIQFEIYEPTMPARTYPFIGIEHGECELYNVDVSNCSTAIYTTAKNTRIKNIRAAYGTKHSSGSSVINVRGGSNHEIEGVYLGTSSYGPEGIVLVGGANQSSGISGTRVEDISHVAPCSSVMINAAGGNIRKVVVDGFEYSGSTATKPDNQVVVKMSGGNSISQLVIDNGIIGETATNGILFQNDSTGTMKDIVIGDIIDAGTTGNGISFVNNSGTLMGISVSDGVRVANRATPFYYSGAVSGIVISPNALPNTLPAYCYDFTIADDSVAAITLNKQMYTGFLLVSVGTYNYLHIVARAAAPPAATTISTSTNMATSTTAMTGTTGTDGKFTIGVTSGVIYLENRLGSSQRVTAVLMTGVS